MVFTLPSYRSAALAAAVVLSFASAYTCSQSEQQTAYGLFKAAAARAGCAPYASYAASGGVTINWSCSTTSCVPTMMQLASQLPNCESQSTGVNSKTTIEYKLYSQCQVCTFDQLDQIDALWKSAAQTSACAPYSSSIGLYTSFSWPCSATGCTAVLTELSSKVPSCYSGGENERTRIINGISACTGTTVSTRTPSPQTTTSGEATTPPATPTPRTTSTPTTTMPTPTSAPTKSPAEASTTDAPASAAGDSDSTCTGAQQNQSFSLWQTAAASSACSSYATTVGNNVNIVWPCSVTSCTDDMAELGGALPDCVLPGLTQSEKSSVLVTVQNCEDSQKYSSQSCSTTEAKQMASLYLSTAASAECKQYATVSTYRIRIVAPCSSTCVTEGFQTLTDALPNCLYAYESENKKHQVSDELKKCAGGVRDRRALASGSNDSVELVFEAATPITTAPVPSPSRESVSASPAASPVRAGGSMLVHWLHLVAVAVVLAVMQ